MHDHREYHDVQLKEPILGPNAKPIFIQAVIGVAVYLTLKAIGVGDFAYWLTCHYLTGSC